MDEMTEQASSKYAGTVSPNRLHSPGFQDRKQQQRPTTTTNISRVQVSLRIRGWRSAELTEASRCLLKGLQPAGGPQKSGPRTSSCLHQISLHKLFQGKEEYCQCLSGLATLAEDKCPAPLSRPDLQEQFPDPVLLRIRLVLPTKIFRGSFHK